MPRQNRRGANSFLFLLVLSALALSALAAPPAESVLYSFPGAASGSNPYGGLIADSTGNLYGTTGVGGSSNTCNLGSGCGTVFMLAPSTGTETVLYSFKGVSSGDGSGP